MKTMWFFLVPDFSEQLTGESWSSYSIWFMNSMEFNGMNSGVHQQWDIEWVYNQQSFSVWWVIPEWPGSNLKASSHQPLFKSGKWTWWTCPVSDMKSINHVFKKTTMAHVMTDYHRTHILRNTWWIVLRYHHKFHCGNWPSPTNIDPEKPILEGSNLPILMNRSVYVSWRKGKIIQLVLMFVLIKSWYIIEYDVDMNIIEILK
jgi:hypothetical protein